MDEIEKVLKKLTAKERLSIKNILEDLRSDNFKSLNIKKLKGREDIFRVRKGDFRIVYRILDSNIFILKIERRRENTYKF